MVHTSSNPYKKSTKNFLNNFLVVVGICISLIAVTYLSNGQPASDPNLSKDNTELITADEESAGTTCTTNVEENQAQVKTHHNFIVSYLLQDNSIDRNTVNSPAQTDLLSNLKQVHKIIISQSIGLF